MVVRAYKLNSFTNSIKGGNPAAVVLNAEDLSDNQMQNLAAMIGYSETAFVSKSQKADFRVRFFTPCAEVDLCGHATIAAFSLMHQRGILPEGEYSQETNAGILRIKIGRSTVFMEQAMPRFFEKIDGDELLCCLGIEKDGLDNELPIQAVSTGLKDLLVPLKSEQVLANLKPNMGCIEDISKKYDAVGLHVFALSQDAGKTAVCRNFAPLYGIPEESATGTSNGALACYLQKYGKIGEHDKEILFQQGIYMNKPSAIKAKLTVQDGKIAEVWVGGEAILLEESTY